MAVEPVDVVEPARHGLGYDAIEVEQHRRVGEHVVSVLEHVRHVCMRTRTLPASSLIKQRVALTGRNITGPPCSVTVELQLDWRRHDVTEVF